MGNSSVPLRADMIGGAAARVLWLALSSFLVAACAPVPPRGDGAALTPPAQHAAPHDAVALLNRLTWGANASSMRLLTALGTEKYLATQLQQPGGAALPAEVQERIDAMSISRQPVETIARELEQRRRAFVALHDVEQRRIAQQAYQDELGRLGREATSRTLLRALYAPAQLHEQMTWFWMNHFNVHQFKGPLRALIGDYEERAIRPHALGRFRDLLAATARHPAMLIYLDNAQNAAGHINENYARELMELHTLGVDGGYTQTDVQELARILTGFGVNATDATPGMRPALRDRYVRTGLFEFNPARHDFGSKKLLGHPIDGGGVEELDRALDLLARHPSTARYVSRKLAIYFVADDPPHALVERMADTFLRSDGDIAAVLRVAFASPEFAQSLGRKFRDPLHYVLGAVRLAYDDKAILNTQPILGWLYRLGEPLYAHETPDGYPLTQDAWASPGQMTTRFEIARAIGSDSAGLFRTNDPLPVEQPAFPQLANLMFYTSMERQLGDATQRALAQARSPQEWNLFLLSSPEFMYR